MKHAPFGLACCRIFVQQICILILKPNLNVTSYLVSPFATAFSRRQRSPQQPWLCLAQAAEEFACARGFARHCHWHWAASCCLLYTGCFICQETRNLVPLSVLHNDYHKRYKSDELNLSCRERVIVLLRSLFILRHSWRLLCHKGVYFIYGSIPGG